MLEQGTTGTVFPLIIHRCKYRYWEKWTGAEGEDCEAPSFTNIKSIKLTTTEAGDYENRSHTEQDCVYVLLFIH